MDISMKTCRKCGTDKTLGSFHASKSKKDGRDSTCKDCKRFYYLSRRQDPKFVNAQRESSRSFRLNNPSYAKEYYTKNREACLTKNSEWRSENRAIARLSQRNYYSKNREEILLKDSLLRKEHPELFRDRERACRERNAESRKAAAKRWASENRHKVCELRARRKARLLQRTPKWLTEQDHFKIETIYLYASAMTQLTGLKHHVDHVIPLNGKLVSGLHVPANLQVLEGSENIRKSNKWVPE